MTDLNLKSFDKLYPMNIHKYESLLPSNDATLLDKINKIIEYLNSVGKLTNDVVKNWNLVYQWAMNDGLKADVNTKLDDMLAKGQFDPILNTVVTKIGDITTLTTTDKTSLTKAVNELVLKMGNLANLTTTDKTSLVNAINENTSKLADNAINVKRFAVIGLNGINDEVDRINLAIQSGTRVFCPEGTYSIPSGKQILPKDNTVLYGVKGKTVFVKENGVTIDSIISIFSPYTTPADSLKNICIYDLVFNGKVDTLNFSQHNHLIAVRGVNGLNISNCDFIGFRGDGILLGVEDSQSPDTVEHRRNTKVIIKDNFFDGVNKDNRNGISVISGDNVKIFHNHITRTTRTDMPGAIDIEPNSYPVYTIKDIEVYGNYIEDIGGNVAAISIVIPSQVQAKNIKVHHNFIRNVYRNFHVFCMDISDSNIEIANNDSVTTTRMGIYLRGVLHKFSFHHNKMLDIHGDIALTLGFDNTETLTLKDSYIDKNIVQTVGNCMMLRTNQIDNVRFRDNLLISETTGVFIQIGYSSGANTSGFNFDNNTFNLSNTPSNIITTSGTKDLKSNTFENNRSNVPLVETDMLFALSNTSPNATLNIVDGTTPLSSFPMGKSTCLINGATGLSGIGTLETYKVAEQGKPYAFISYQIFTLSTSQSIRYWDGTNNAWLPFKKFAMGATGAAIPDTTGATLADLEIEVNKLKAMLRSFGMIS